MKKEILKILHKTFKAGQDLQGISEHKINRALRLMGKLLLKNKSLLLRKNRKDILEAEKGNASQAFIDRLSLSPSRIKAMVLSLKAIADLKSPVGEVIERLRRPNGLLITKVRVPLGMVAIIYEARPNVTSDCVGLCLKSYNTLVLRGGSASLNSNLAITGILKKALKDTGVSENVFNYISLKAHKAVDIMLKEGKGLIDVVIPRGGESLIKSIEKVSKIPVIKHYKGVCHIYVDKDARIDMALRVCLNAKVQRPGVCNAMETLLVHTKIARAFLPRMHTLFKDRGVAIRGCPLTRRILPNVEKAGREDWSREYLDLILSVRIVNSLEEAIEHINTYGTKHSESIITQDYKAARKFLQKVDACAVYHNASTRFTDGYEFGLGAEMGISTDKLHARGPMALKELTTYKYVIYGNGQIRK